MSVRDRVSIEPVEQAPRRFRLGRLLADRRGATAIEYALIAGLIGLAVTPALRTSMSTVWNVVLNGVTSP